MKYIVISFLFLLAESFAQNISGNVQDFLFNVPLEEVGVILKNNTDGSILGTDSTDASGNYSIDYIIVNVDDNKSLPTQYYLSNPYPQPFNPSAKFDFNNPRQGSFDVKIYNIIGQLLYTKNLDVESGKHSFVVSGLGSAGVYLFNISGKDFSSTKKLVLLDGGSNTNINVELTSGTNSRISKINYGDLKVEFRKAGYVNKDTVIAWQMYLQVDAKLHQVTEYHSITIEAFVPMSGINQPLLFYTAKLKNTQGAVLQTIQSGNSNTITFNNVPSPANYIIELAGDTASRPNFITKDTTLVLSSDLQIQIFPQLYLRPVFIDPLSNKNFNEDEPPADRILHDLWAKVSGYDSLGNIVPDSEILFEISNQTNTNIVNVTINNNRFTWLDSLMLDGNGTSAITVRATSSNGRFQGATFNVIVTARTDRRGQLKDTEGNARQGYIYARNSAGQQFILQTNSDGTFAYQLNPSAWDSLKAQIQNDVRPNEGGFIRSLYFTTNNDQNNIVVDAVPHLNGTDYIGLDTLDSFIKEANFDSPQGNNIGKLKKADLNNMLDFITSHNAIFGDTITAPEQDYIISIIGQRIDPYFDQPSAKWKVPQDSTVTSMRNNAINWLKDQEGWLGSIGTWDSNSDGILEKAAITLRYIIHIYGQDSTYNDKIIVQEGLSGRVAPGEVGIISPIDPDKTILHINTGAPGRMLQPADKWLVDIAKNYPVLTQHDEILKIGNLQSLFNKIKSSP